MNTITRTRLLTAATALAVVVLVATAAACGGYKHDPQTVFPQSWKSSYVKVSECSESGDHNPGNVEVWINAEAAEDFKNAGPYKPGTVFIKPQYNDKSCQDFELWTAMKKGAPGSAPESEDWLWQTVYGDGKLAKSGPNPFCTDCHSACNGFVCTE